MTVLDWPLWMVRAVERRLYAQQKAIEAATAKAKRRR